MRRTTIAAAALAALIALSGCTAAPAPPDPAEERLAKRQLDAIALTVEEYGAGWMQLEGQDGEGGGGPTDEVPELNPCTWATNWMPAYDFYYQDTWRTVTAGDGATFAGHWIMAAEDDVDLEALLTQYRETLAACGSTEQEDASGRFVITIVPDIEPIAIGDASFSYRAEYTTLDGVAYGTGELHNFVCGPLWVQLSYIGYDPFVERDALLTKLQERAAELGGC